MHLYLIRHADAVPLGEHGISNDPDRPLTSQGQDQCRSLAEALTRQGVHLDRLVTSPYLRAHQTAEGLLEHLPGPHPELVVCDDLTPGSKRRRLTRFLRDLEAESVAIVGHNPDLSVYLAWLLGNKNVQIELAKAGVARVEFEGRVGKSTGTLAWMVTPDWYPQPGANAQPSALVRSREPEPEAE
jgi:phosphohistidine phosphatase